MPKTHAELDEKSDFQKLTKERSAAVLLRDDICFIIGCVQNDEPDIAERLEKALAVHAENRCQYWL